MKKSKPKRTRLNLRLPTELNEWMKVYAGKKETSVTQLIVDYFIAVRTQEESNAGAG